MLTLSCFSENDIIAKSDGIEREKEEEKGSTSAATVQCPQVRPICFD